MDSLNDSSIQLMPGFEEAPPSSSRRQTRKVMENQSDDPADNSDDERGDEIGLEDLHIGTIALKDPTARQTTSRRAFTNNRSVPSAPSSLQQNK